MSKSGIVNVRMVITEEKILSNIEKVQKMINPNSKKQIVQLEEDTYFKGLIESVKSYLIEYPKKKNFPISVYKASYGLVEYATNQFEENTKKIEELIRQREQNIALAGQLKEILESVENRDESMKNSIKEAEKSFSEDILEALNVIARSRNKTSQNYEDSVKLLNARINNLETNLHIEIDMERIEDRSKALSYIGIEIADALKTIPAPVEKVEEAVAEEVEEQKIQDPVEIEADEIMVQANAIEEITPEPEVKEKVSLWQKIKNSKLVRAINYLFKIRVVLQYPALPEGRGENY